MSIMSKGRIEEPIALCDFSNLLMSPLHQWNQRIYWCKKIDSDGWKYRNLRQESTIRLHSRDVWCSFSGQSPHPEQLTSRDSTLPIILYTNLFGCEFSFFPSLWTLSICIKPTTFEMITQSWVNMTPAAVAHTILIMENLHCGCLRFTLGCPFWPCILVLGFEGK